VERDRWARFLLRRTSKACPAVTLRLHPKQALCGKTTLDFSAPHKAYFNAMMRIEMLCKQLEIKQFQIVSPETPR